MFTFNKTKALAVAKINFRTIDVAIIITASLFLSLILQDIVFLILNRFRIEVGSSDVGIGNYLYLLVLLSAIFIPARNFRRIANLGGKRDDFFFGSFVTYAIMAAAVSLAGIILYYTYERFLMSYYGLINLNVLYWFGWIARGPIVAFFQQFAFLLLLAVFTHTLTAIQDKWYGWVTDILIVAIISVFTPIAPLRSALIWFFQAIIFHPSALFQITFCLVLSVAIYTLNKPVLERKAI